ncbi:TVP38/TMEM64 family protein [Salirhabdus salicampi]|uniref:TVP38/TMEM64 family protein n=1 Tax=Salirhabdus salicampi TaxID=476102 RepID=UPI0020C4B8FB|nr:TVP38/TMEM64 family protein [Salirhabdus salicampi]MCP8615536.1 TVP38/TMEM64 family protein [Salirhabdus salicampi]
MSLQVNSFSDFKQIIENDQLDAYVMQLLDSYEKLGPLPGILLPLLEALLPFLPLIVFVLANSMAYGLFEGFLYSWLGSVLGAIIVFFIIRRLGETKFFRFIRNHKQVQKVTFWFEKHGFGPLFILLCFPFSPSAIINTVAALSRIKFQQFILAVVLGKAVMIFTIAYVGASIKSFATQPVKSIVVGICILLFWMVGKIIEKRLQQKSNNANEN